jgi:hypothetical protein
MASKTSKYFKHTSNISERDLIDKLTIESIKLRGLTINYFVREKTVNIDKLFGEDPTNTFAKGIPIEVYLLDLQGFGGEGDFIAGFGLDIRDEATFIIAKTRFEEEITKKYPDVIRPMEGDLITCNLGGDIFEITFVEHEKPFYQIGKTHAYEMTCKMFQSSHEKFDDKETDDIIQAIPDYPDLKDNDIIEKEGTEIIDFSEINPFAEE